MSITISNEYALELLENRLNLALEWWGDINDKDLFLDIFSNEFYPKNINIYKVIDICLSKQKFLQFIDPVYVYKVSMVSNQKNLDDLEALLINRK